MIKISARDTSLDERELKEEALDHVLDNRDQYDGDTDYEALGAAVYVEQIITGERDDIEVEDVTEYIARNDIDDQKFVQYKADLADDYQEFVDTMEGFFSGMEDFIDDLEANGVMYQALYEEARNERDNAEEAMQNVSDMVSGFDMGSDWLEGDIDDIDPGGGIDTGDDGDDPEYPGGGTRRRRRSRGSSSGPSANFNFGQQDISGDFDPWANFNFGEQEISGGWSDWSDYNFSWGGSDGESSEEGGSSDWWDEFEPDWSGAVINNNQNRVVNRINLLEPSET